MSESTPTTGGHRRGRTAAAVALVLAVLGGIMIAVSVASQESPPPLPGDTAGSASQSRSSAPPEAPATGGAEPDIDGPVLEPSEPVALSIPAIDVRSPLLHLGLRDDRTLQVPPEEPDSKAGWFDRSPTPGEAGPSILLGHVDSAEHGPAVFFELTKLAEGDKVIVDRADGTTAVFRVDRTERYVKNEFPTHEVYGNIDHAGLRLITCGGEFDLDEGSYEDNIVTYATLESSHPTE
ncbi:class F sortase [Haloechinothrix sp. YIM 98757]|uniref:Class F sortase n=1 Tax=Haloechinothrix aidingensis TaxID=2752311 RepID=A0A838ACP1_9PSEU|nr:class F sortase [Haloechinothrix aidingensis]MBA0127032.1 class F sortase [Haloechinothrix aidingensis]